MQKLKHFLKSMPPDERARFCVDCGTTEGYLRKAISQNQKLGPNLCIEIEKASGRKVTCEDLRDDCDWAYLRENPLLDLSSGGGEDGHRQTDGAALQPS